MIPRQMPEGVIEGETKVEIESGPLTPAKMKVTELRDALAARGLSPKGLKKDLVQRLEEALKDRKGPTRLRHTIDEDTMSGDDTEVEEGEEEIRLGSPSKRGKVGLSQESNDDNMEYNPGMQVEITSVGRDFGAKGSELGAEREHTINCQARLEFMLPPMPQNNDFAAHPTYQQSASIVVHITNFIRPFTIPAVKELVGQFGSILDFWMDNLKSQCFVRFESNQAAEECIRRLNGLKWPLETGRPLSAVFSTLETMNTIKTSESQPKPSSPSMNDSPIILDKLFMKTETSPSLYFLPAHNLEE